MEKMELGDGGKRVVMLEEAWKERAFPLSYLL